MNSAPSQPKLDLDINGLYVILSDQGTPDRWHWGFYLHQAKECGVVMHATYPDGYWFYAAGMSSTVLTSEAIITAIKIAVVDPDMHEALCSRISEVPIENTSRFGTFTCRTFVLRAIHELDGEGYISLKPSYTAENIEFEANDAALKSTRILKTVKRSQYSLA